MERLSLFNFYVMKDMKTIVTLIIDALVTRASRAGQRQAERCVFRQPLGTHCSSVDGPMSLGTQRM